MTSPVVLINVFEVTAGMEDDFIEWWKHHSEVLKKEPGFLDAKLHRSLNPDSRFQFINVAHWETAESLDQARKKNEDVLQRTSSGKGTPALYGVEVEYWHVS
ncbi:MAG: antibiotic biosynthesis monooxygenase [Chloroflexota bacterium]|nr:antibiotic biosynthesis monooxygenase [Chloroflexota bacterium]